MRKRTSNAADFGRVAVLMGGWSAEREVSLWSGQGVVEALRRRGVDAVAVDVSRDTLLSLGSQGYARAFNVLHGTGGEDGTLQAVLDLQGVPYTGSGVLASALTMDKLRTKRMWKAEGLPTPEWMALREPADALRAAEQFGYPLFIKPSEEGSSVGISKVKAATQLGSAFRRAHGDYEKRPRGVLAERYIAGGEYTCAILDGRALPLIRIEPEGEFYDYHAKYISDRTRYHCPSNLDPLHESELSAMCARAFELVGGRGWGRVDFMLDAQGQPWLLEINTVPGMTSHSLVPMAARAAGMDYEALCWAVLETTLEHAPVAKPPPGQSS
jgi:D-alanine-D-alanine ligase